MTTATLEPIDTQASTPTPAGDAHTGAAHHPALRFITCGSVDDGKSTLIGRLLVDS